MRAYNLHHVYTNPNQRRFSLDLTLLPWWALPKLKEEPKGKVIPSAYNMQAPVTEEV